MVHQQEKVLVRCKVGQTQEKGYVDGQTHLTVNRLGYNFLFEWYTVHRSNRKLRQVTARPQCSATAHTSRRSTHWRCSSTQHLLLGLQVHLSSSQFRPSPGVSVQGCPAQCVKHGGASYIKFCTLIKLRGFGCNQPPALIISRAVRPAPESFWGGQKALCAYTSLGAQSCEVPRHPDAGAERTGEAAGSRQCYSRLHPLRTPKCNQEKGKDGIYVLNSAADKLDES